MTLSMLAPGRSPRHPSRPRIPIRSPGRPRAPAGLAMAAVLASGLAAPLVSPAASIAQEAVPLTPARVIQDAPDDAWRPLDPERTVYMTLGNGRRVILELVPEFAPRHVDNIRAMVRAGLFDGGAVVRSQDNYVVQWAIGPVPESAREEAFRGIAAELEPEFTFDPAGLAFTPLPDGDVYAPQVGFSRGFPVARDPAAGTAWVIHCYGVVGVARGNAPSSGNGSSLYAVNGHSPRQLDRNLSMPGRIVSGMDHLSVLPRGTDDLGFYATEEEYRPIASARMGADLPPEERSTLQIMRTDSPAFLDWIEARRTRVGDWWLNPPRAISVCNVGVPTRDPAVR